MGYFVQRAEGKIGVTEYTELSIVLFVRVRVAITANFLMIRLVVPCCEIL